MSGMVPRRPGRRKNFFVSQRSRFWTGKQVLVLTLMLSIAKLVTSFDQFTSFTFGAQPGGEPRFSYGGFFPGAAASGKAVDNEEYYKLLAVKKTADPSTITKAYRNLARQKHPDKGGDPEEFKALAEAYEVLSDPEKRQMYDQFGKEGVAGGADGGGMQKDQADFFRSFFGRFGQPQPVRMRDVVYEMEFTLEELAKGGSKKVRIWSEGDGDGGRSAKDIEIELNADMSTGTRVVVEGGVEPIEENIEPGDLVFVVKEARHRTFRRLTENSHHLTADITVTLAEALTGFIRPITLVDGRTVYYKSGDGEIISPGAARKLKGCGLPLKGRTAGDLYLRFNVEFPDSGTCAKWDEDAKKTLEKLLPPKPKFHQEKKNRPVDLEMVEPHVQSRFKAGLYDRSSRRSSPNRGWGGGMGSAGSAGSPFGFFGL